MEIQIGPNMLHGLGVLVAGVIAVGAGFITGKKGSQKELPALRNVIAGSLLILGTIGLGTAAFAYVNTVFGITTMPDAAITTSAYGALTGLVCYGLSAVARYSS